jgi:hypothetical protein
MKSTERRMTSASLISTLVLTNAVRRQGVKWGRRAADRQRTGNAPAPHRQLDGNAGAVLRSRRCVGAAQGRNNV